MIFCSKILDTSDKKKHTFLVKLFFSKVLMKLEDFQFFTKSWMPSMKRFFNFVSSKIYLNFDFLTFVTGSCFQKCKFWTFFQNLKISKWTLTFRRITKTKYCLCYAEKKISKNNDFFHARYTLRKCVMMLYQFDDLKTKICQKNWFFQNISGLRRYSWFHGNFL